MEHQSEEGKGRGGRASCSGKRGFRNEGQRGHWTVKSIVLTIGQTGDGRKREELLGAWQEYKQTKNTKMGG